MESHNHLAIEPNISGLSSFDIAFLLLTGHYQIPMTSFDRAFMVLKDSLKKWRDVSLWGPQARLLKRATEQARRKELMAVLTAYQNLLTDAEKKGIKVNKKKLKELNEGAEKAAAAMWGDVSPKATALTLSTIEASTAYQASKLAVTIPKITKSAVKSYLFKASMSHLASFVLSYPNRILEPEIQRLVTIVETNPSMRSIDRYDLTQRLDKIVGLGSSYFSGLSDVQIGRVWTWTALKLGQEQKREKYQVIAELDNKTCKVCFRLHGKDFYLEPALRKLDEIVKEGNEMTPEELADEIPFPKISDIDNMTREELMESGFEPPFHNNCRCDIVLL